MDGHDYRLEKITEIQMNLEEQRLKRLELSENYYKAVKWVNNADVVLITLSMGLGAAGCGSFINNYRCSYRSCFRKLGPMYWSSEHGWKICE